MRMGIRFVVASVIAVLGLGLVAIPVKAAPIGINFNSSKGPGGNVPVTVTADAFGVPQASWINLPKSSTSTDYGSFAVNGGAISIVTTNAGAWSMGDYTPLPGEQEIAHGYLEDGSRIRISGLSSILAPQQTYSVSVIMASDNTSGFSDVTITDLVTNDTLGMVSPGMLVRPAEAPARAGYAQTATLAGLTNDSIEITSQRDGDIRATLAGVIITPVPEPTGLFGLGLGSLVLLKRRR